MPFAFESFNFSEYDVVISVTSEAAKGIITFPRTLHICYCLTPTRYLWSGYKEYLGKSARGRLAGPIVSYLRKWDRIAAQRPDVMVGISKNVAARIKRYYGREAKVIYPPVELQSTKSQAPNFKQVQNTKYKILNSGYFLVVSRLVPYKKVDLAIQAFNELCLPLVVVGTGSEEERLKKIAKRNVRFMGTVIEGKTGMFFDKQTPEVLAAAVQKFRPDSFNPEDCIKNARKFNKKKFLKEFATLISTVNS
ncbi:MAG: glycosyltransferase [Candidatus Blackburnbacteria bacterium]|nr:glycosyltransferase [Candidatus Blackburnbacteria bacterium]